MTEEKLNNLNHYLQEMELPFASTVVIALIRDALAGAGDPADIISRRLYQIAGVVLPGDNDPLLFEQLIFDLYKDVQASFDKEEDETFAPLRSRIMDLIDKWLQLSDFMNEEEQKELQRNNEIQAEMEKLLTFVQSLLERLNHPEDETPDSVKELSFLLDQSESVFGRFMGQVEEMLNPHMSHNGECGDESILILRVELKESGHPVWRKIRVSGQLTLGQFHLVLQKVMGWWDLYDHSFEQAGSFWGSSAQEDDGIVYQDEGECILNSLLNEEDHMLHYHYDLSEGWHHIIRVDEVQDGCDTPSLGPVCQDGKGACPPEDCGGPEGFRMILASLKPDAPSDLKEDFSWLGDFDPKKFDLDIVNKELSELV
ncbi:MAG: hypothetical protein B6241_11105 [Spirochaetaceae bacterium 4572_59]|nr:MAG: hypothetical protein B6241_11105 [Spirochaetaceae bacterium 4572_59]